MIRGALFGVVQGLVLHEDAFRRSGLAIAPDQLADWDVSAGQVLEQALRLDPAPLAERRPPERRVAGQCSPQRCALLRAAPQPRAFRPGQQVLGFVSDLQPGAWVCHWVTGRWDGDRWVCEDADTGRHDLDAGAFRCPGRKGMARLSAGRRRPRLLRDRAELGLAPSSAAACSPTPPRSSRTSDLPLTGGSWPSRRQSPPRPRTPGSTGSPS